MLSPAPVPTPSKKAKMSHLRISQNHFEYADNTVKELSVQMEKPPRVTAVETGDGITARGKAPVPPHSRCVSGQRSSERHYFQLKMNLPILSMRNFF